MYSTKIENLINIALADGELTEKKKQILFKNAEAEGIDLDEFEMVIESRLIEKQKNIKSEEIHTSSLTINEPNASITKLFEMLHECETEKGTLKGTFGNLAHSITSGGDRITEKKKSIITGFPIPNTKSDILEFLSLAVPNSIKKGNIFTSSDEKNKIHNDLVPTWKSKCEQIIIKAKFSIKDDNSTLEEIMRYANELGLKV